MTIERERPDPHRRTWSLRVLLPLLLCALVAGAVAPVVLLGYFVAFDTASRFVGGRAELILDGVEGEVRRQVEPIEAQLGLARKAVAEGRIDVGEPEAFDAFMLGLLAATPQVYGIGFVRPDGSMRRWERGSLREIEEPASNVPLGGEALAAARAGRTAMWSAPFVSPVSDDAILIHRVAIERDGELLGVLAAALRASDIAKYLADVSERLEVTAFVLAGRDRVFAYPGRTALEGQNRSLSLAPVAAATDPVVRAIWKQPRPFTTAVLDRSLGHWTEVDGEPYTYVYRELEGFGPDPLVVAIAAPSVASRWDRWAPRVTAGLGAVLAGLAMLLAWWIGRRLTRPVEALDGALAEIEALEFAKVDVTAARGTNVREWQAMAERIERTADALARLGVYVPQVLSRRLLGRGMASVAPQERVVTVMFVDLEGFSAFARGRDPAEVAAYLSSMFTRIGPIIEREGGVIDKYTGDGLLAFWGAPDPEPDHAACALKAATAMVEAWQDTPDDEPRLRIGIHTGPVIVGEMGFPGRLDYTLTGETVNQAERTQSAMRGRLADRRAVIGLTQDTYDVLGGMSKRADFTVV